MSDVGWIIIVAVLLGVICVQEWRFEKVYPDHLYRGRRDW
jgi:hypothetical protein